MKLRYLYQTRIGFLGEKCLSGITVYKCVQWFDVINSSAEERYCGSVNSVSTLQQV